MLGFCPRCNTEQECYDNKLLCSVDWITWGRAIPMTKIEGEDYDELSKIEEKVSKRMDGDKDQKLQDNSNGAKSSTADLESNRPKGAGGSFL